MNAHADGHLFPPTPPREEAPGTPVGNMRSFWGLLTAFWRSSRRAEAWALAILIKDDYALAGVPMLPVVKGVRATTIQIAVYTVLTVAITLLPVLFRRKLDLHQTTFAMGEAVAHLHALAGPVRALDRASGLLARLRRVPLRLIVGLARQGLGEALSSKERRATVLAGVATGAAALVNRWRRRKQRRSQHAAPKPHD